MTTPPQAVIFDLDGCLADSEPLSLETLAAEMRAIGVPWASFELVRERYLGRTSGDVCRDIAEYLGRPCPAGFVDNYLGRLFEAYETELKPIPPMVALLDAVQAAGIATCIASGGGLERIARTLAITGLGDRFGERTFSGEQVPRGKPAPDLVLFSAAQLGVAPEHCVVVEDSPHGVEGARAAGMRALGYTGGSHLDGIRGAHAELLRVAGAELVSEDASDLLKALGLVKPA
ncbi:MAG: HAD family hydrolase [Tropicimonas sp.]|uniref:HAD family hydrolase n=1 Tax=Tropicimonas sp. TaxID=2067044 RepID=UPI003A885740